MADAIARDELADDSRQVMWEAIIVESSLKSKLLNWAVLALHLRATLSRAKTAVTGLALLHGPPGTGKTTLARGLAGPLREFVAKPIRVIEIDAHALMSAEHGQSQRATAKLLGQTLPGLTRDENPSIVILDEVESLAVARSAASLDANPVDVHRTTDATIAAIDVLADECPNVIVVATTNFSVTVDDALLSRADVSIEVPAPDDDAIEKILRVTLAAYGEAYPEMKVLADDPSLRDVGTALSGRDARQVRKFVADTLAADVRTAAAPGTLTMHQLLTNAREAT